MEKAPQNMEIVLKYFADFTGQQLEQLGALYELYRGENEKVNVISRKDIESLYEKHVLHSLSIAALTEFPPGSAVLDIGTGGGFPGIPLAIFFPEARFVLADSIAKKTRVVQTIADRIGLTNVTVMNTRVEEIRNQKFDYTVSRAVAPLKDLWRWSKPLLRKRAAGTLVPQDENLAPGLICLKGGDLAEEISLSGVKPSVMEIHDLFPEEAFREKYIVYVPV